MAKLSYHLAGYMPSGYPPPYTQTAFRCNAYFCGKRSSMYRRQHTVHSLIPVWQVEVHNGIKYKAQLSALLLLWISLWWQELVNVRIPDAIHFLHAMPHHCYCLCVYAVTCPMCLVQYAFGKPLEHSCLACRPRTVSQNRSGPQQQYWQQRSRSGPKHNDKQDTWQWWGQTASLRVETDVECRLQTTVTTRCKQFHIPDYMSTEAQVNYACLCSTNTLNDW